MDPKSAGIGALLAAIAAFLTISQFVLKPLDERLVAAREAMAEREAHVNVLITRMVLRIDGLDERLRVLEQRGGPPR